LQRNQPSAGRTFFNVPIGAAAPARIASPMFAPTSFPLRVGATLALMVAVATPVLATQTADACYPDWAEAAPIVRREQLAAVADLSRMARERNSGEIIKTTLCAERGRYVYRLVVREASGVLRNLTVDAKQPFGR
jgi:hypothetical protein